MYVCRLTERYCKEEQGKSFGYVQWRLVGGIYVVGMPLTSLSGHQSFILQPWVGCEVLVYVIKSINIH